MTAAPRQWRRNQLAVTIAGFIGFMSFTLVMPFLPLYFRELGAADVGEIAFWTGISLGVTPAMTALLAPLWGRLADRFGRKIMVERSLASFVVVMAATAFVTRPWHVFALRAVQGFFAGYGALTLTMAAESAPRDRLASAIGLVQTAQRLGPTVGPVVGGVLAQAIGLRPTFLVAAGLYAAAFVLVLVLYQEPRIDAAAQGSMQPARTRLRDVLRYEHFALLMGTIFGLQYVERSFGPLLPLYVGMLGTAADRVALASGVLFSIAAIAAALGHHAAARVLRAHAPRRVIVCAALGAAVAVSIVTAAPNLAWLSVGMCGAGLCLGIAMTTCYTVGGTVIPVGAHGTAFGFLTSASLTGVALSPVLSGLLGARSVRLVFALDVAALVVVAAVVARFMVVHRDA